MVQLSFDGSAVDLEFLLLVLILFSNRGFLDRVDGHWINLDVVGSVGLRGVENGSVHSGGLPLGDLALIKVQLSDSGLDGQFELTLKFTLSDIISFLQVFVIRNVNGISCAVFVSDAEVLGLEFWLDLLAPCFQGLEVRGKLAQSLRRSGSAHLDDEFFSRL